MAIRAQNLPSDPATLQAIIAGLTAQLSARDALIDQLRAQLDALKRARFGASSEKIDRSIEQLELQLEELETGEAEAAAQADDDIQPPQPEKDKPARKAPPEHLPRDETRYDDPPKACVDCGCAKLRRTGERVEEVLEYVPASFRVLRRIREPIEIRVANLRWEPDPKPVRLLRLRGLRRGAHARPAH